ncbi:MAG: tetratricopeptide repeat protein, partial [bacterium]|nr:tetratricopeptide repeat protein [bacterium]
YSFFLLLSLLAFTLSQRHRSFYWLSLIAFMLGLLSSDKAVVFLPILIAFSFTFSSLKKDVRRLIPFVLLTLFGLWRLLAQVGERVANLRDIHYEAPVTYNPLLQIPIAISSYLELIFWPQGLTLYHTEMSFTQTQYLIRLVIFGVVVGLAIWGLFKNRKVFFWLAFFFIALSPTLTPWGLSWIVAERYAYLSAIGIYVLIAYFLKRVGEPTKIKPLLQVGLTLLILLLSIRTIVRNHDWRTADDLWLSAAKTSPSSHVNHNNLGDLYARRGQPEQAIAEFKTAIKLKPNYADAFHNLANTYKDIGLDKEALFNYQEAIRYNPALWQSYQNIATLYFQQGLYDKAATNLQEAVRINPQNTFLHSNLGAVYLAISDKAKAKAEFMEALRLEPTNEFAKRGLSEL